MAQEGALTRVQLAGVGLRTQIALRGIVGFDDAFGDKVAREEVIELVSRGKYRVSVDSSAQLSQ